MEEEEKSGGIHPAVYGVLTIVQGIAFIVAGLAALYLLYGLFSGGLNNIAGQSLAEKQRVLTNVTVSGQFLAVGLFVGAICTAFIYFTTEIAGYLLLLLAAVGFLGIPFIYSLTIGDASKPGVGVANTFEVFRNAVIAPGLAGAVLVIRDLVVRMVNAIRGRQFAFADLTLGGDATEEKKPRRTSVLGKCWEGNYCREYIRAHCPIFLSRKACWKERKGCYCEEEIVTSAASKSTIGVQLEMAPVSGYNFANPSTPGTHKAQLTEAQKIQRCHSCVIYNDHQTEKYKVLVPLALLATVILMAVFAFPLKLIVHQAFGSIDKVIEAIAFSKTKVNLAKPSDLAEWIFISALGLMACSKALQVLEWFVFKLKV
jgi:hypothetical protein